jgi:predicted MPP superfamily phosphohydrolase
LLLDFVLRKLLPNLKFTNWIVGLVILGLVIVITLYGLVNASNIKIHKLDLNTSKELPSISTNLSYNSNLRIVQITDLHIGAIHSKAYLDEVVRKVNSQNPDVVMLTGDLIDGRYTYEPHMFDPLNNITAPIYFVNGNHEQYAGLAMVKSVLNHTKIIWLKDEAQTLKIRDTTINVIGLEYGSSKDTIKQYFDNLDSRTKSKFSSTNSDKNYTVLLVHTPLGWRDAAPYADLMLSGHTHGGQIWPFTYLALMANQAVEGIYSVNANDTFRLYVNPGTGTWGPPMRLGTHTEIAVIDVHK